MKKKEKKIKEKKPKKEKKQKVLEPQYYTSATNIPTLNYKVYYMKKTEKALYFLAAFAVGAAVGYLFYGGIGKDAYGDPTMLTYVLNTVISAGVGFLAGKMFLPIRTGQIIRKRQKKLKEQFRDMLDSLTTAIGAGNNVVDSFYKVREDMTVQYDEDAYILKEVDVILSGIQNSVPVEDVLMDFGRRSGISDIVSFASVFQVSYRKGGNLKDIIQSTHSILSDKMEVAEEIETVVTSSKMEQNIMVFMPIMLIGMIKSMSPEFGANFATPSGIASTTIAVGCFAGAYYLGKAILDIKI